MFEALLILLTSIVVSFAGSVQLGPVNLLVIDTALFNNKKQAVIVAIGGSLPEFIYCTIAVYLNAYLEDYQSIFYVFKIVFICVLLIYAVVYFLKKRNDLTEKIYTTKSDTIGSFMKGFTMGLFNPQLLPFWMAIQLYLNSTKHLKIVTPIDSAAFITGSGIGAFILLFVLIITIYKHQLAVLKIAKSKYYNKVISVILFIIASRLLLTL